MAGVDVGSGAKGKRGVSADVNMVPFIDLLLVTVAFLLITAVWVQSSQIEANAQIPGPPGPTDEVSQALHVQIEEDGYRLSYKRGGVTLSEQKVAKNPADPELGELKRAIADAWRSHGVHKNPADRVLDTAVLHTENRLPYRDIVAVMDAIQAPKRELAAGSRTEVSPVFNTTFAIR